MKLENIILIGVLVLVGIALIYSLSGFFGLGTGTKSTSTAAAQTSVQTTTSTSGYKSITTGSTSSGDVSVELTPHKMITNQLTVDFSINTHSVDLSQFELKQITTLEYNGKTINPTSAPGMSGHHNSGEMIFNVGEKIDSFKITIKGIPAVQVREFKW